MYNLEYPWLLILLPLPLLVYWLLPAYKEEQDSLRLTFFDYISSSLGLTPQPGAVVPRTNWLQKLLAPLCWGLIVLALARPQLIEPPIQKIQPGRDLMLALDISQSMETPDFRTPDGKRLRRVDAVKQVVGEFIRKRKNDRIGLIVFGQAAYPVTPFTLDHDAGLQILDQTDAGMAGPQTMIGDAIGLAIKQFNNSEAKQRVLILLTDGNDTGSRMPPRKAAEIASQNGITIHVVGLGDPRATGEDKVDYNALNDIAKATGGQVFHGENRVELEKAYATLDKITPQNFKTLSYQPRRELFMFPLGAAVLLFVGRQLLMLLASLTLSFSRVDGKNRTKLRPRVSSRCMYERVVGSGASSSPAVALVSARRACDLPFTRFRDDVRFRWKRYIVPALLEHLIVSRKRRWRLRPVHMISLLILIGAIAMAGPTWKREQPPFTEDKAPLVIALDLSETMNAIDLDPTRLERVKLKLRELFKARNGARTALFVYANTAHMVLPFTTDNSLFDLYLSSLSTSLMPSQGKNTAKALRAIEDFLKDEPVPGTILFVTDGIEPQALPEFRKFATAQDNQNDILVLGVGTSNGGPVRTAGNGFLSDRTGRRVYAKLDVNALRSLSRIDIPATTLTLNDDDIHWIQHRVQHHLETLQQKNSKTRWIDEGYWLTFPIAAIAVFWFRKGWTVRWSSAALAVFFVLPPSNVQSGFTWIDLWLTHDQQGRYYFQKGDYQRASDRFDDPLWRGLSFARAGEYDNALNAFALSDSAEAWFNQGDALAHLAKYPEAVAAYQQALARRHPWSEAQENLILVQSLIPKTNDKDKDKEQQEIPPNLPPDQMRFDKEVKTGKKIQVQVDPKKIADIWMRNIQTTPADFLRRRFAVQAAEERHP